MAAERLKIAWAVPPQERKEAIRPLIDAAREQQFHDHAGPAPGRKIANFIKFLGQIASKAESERRSVIVLTHHNGFEEDGSAPTLLEEVMAAFPVELRRLIGIGGMPALESPMRDSPTACVADARVALPWGFRFGIAE